MTDSPAPTTAPREWRLASRPTGWPTPENFELAESDLPELQDGQIRVRNEVLSVDPYMRGRMSAAKSYAAPYAVGEAMTGGAVGVVEESRAEGFKPGGASLHNAFVPHGPDADAFDAASNAELKPHKLDNTLAFMFETRWRLQPSRFALDGGLLDTRYADCWSRLQPAAL